MLVFRDNLRKAPVDMANISQFHIFFTRFLSISTGAGFLQLVVEMRNGISSQKLSDIRNPEFRK